MGDEKDFIQFAYYAGIVSSMTIYPLIGRFSRYFLKKHLLLLCISFELILSTLMVCLNNDWLLFLLNFLLSGIKMIGLITCIGIFMKMINPNNSRGLFYGIYYAISFTLNQIYSYLVAVILLNNEWQHSFIIGVPGLCISLCIVLIGMHNIRNERKYPLFQIDWIGYFLFIIFGLSLAYGCIFGERLLWLEDPSIRVSFIVTVITFLLWLLRMKTAKRPYIKLDVLQRYPHTAWGVSLMIILFLVYNTFNISTEFMKVNLRYDDKYTAFTNLYMLPSFIFVIPVTGIWLHKHHKAKEPLFIGFILFAVYYFFTAHIFYPEENDNFFLFPMMLRAAAYGICITTLSYYASVNIAAEDNPTRAFFSIASRNVFAAPVTSALWQDRFNYAKQRHITYISSKYSYADATAQSILKSSFNKAMNSSHDPQTAAGLAESGIRNTIYKEALISGAQDIYYIIALICIIIAVSVVSLRVLNIHYKKIQNEYPLTQLNAK